MLILTRRMGDSISIGNQIRVVVLEIKGHQVRIGIQAPRSIPIYRDELYRWLQARGLQGLGVEADEAGESEILQEAIPVGDDPASPLQVGDAPMREAQAAKPVAPEREPPPSPPPFMLP